MATFDRAIQPQILIIDDEPDTLLSGVRLLNENGYGTMTASKPEEGLKLAVAKDPDLILLDIRMPGMDGFTVLKELKALDTTRKIPVILLSVQAEEANVVAGLEMGADDFIRKPFRRRELMARVKAVLRRAENRPEENRLQLGPLTIDLSAYKAEIKGTSLDLRNKEFQLLAFFVRREGRVLTRAAIAENVWGGVHLPTSRAIDERIKELRKKLGAHAHWIQSLRGVGYRFEMGEDET